MPPRFFSEQPIESATVEIAGQEHQHMTKVMRLAAGDCVVLFDGTGVEFAAQIAQVHRASVQCQISERLDVNRELRFPLTLAVALPKGDRQQWLVEKATELGVTRLVPLITERGVAQPRDKSLGKLERWVIAASKQSGRNRLMQIDKPHTLAEFSSAQAADANSDTYFAHPYGDTLSFSQCFRTVATGERGIALAVGPEGGFSPREIDMARENGHSAVSLGARILRIETAAVAWVSALVLSADGS